MKHLTAVLAAGCALGACGGGGGGSSVTSSTPVASAADAALTFLRAAADSNVTRMAELWGTNNGPASRTNQPEDYQRRIVVMQTYLWNDSSKVIGQAAVPGNDSRRTVTVALWRSGCMRQLPFEMVRTRDGSWLVQDPKLGLAGNPARPCDGETPPRDDSMSRDDASPSRLTR